VLRAERETYRTVDEIGEVVEREGIDCGFSKGGMLTIATSAPQAERVRADLAVARAHRLPEEDFRQLEEGELEQLVRLSRCRLAAYSPHCARIDPARLVRALADACERVGVVIHERTEALELAPGRVRSREGTVTAD